MCRLGFVSGGLRRLGRRESQATLCCAPKPEREREFALFADGFRSVCGVDEVGRGPLAGPVVAAAVVLPKKFGIVLKGDSKKYSEKKRLQVYEQLVSLPGLRYATSVVSAQQIDEINIRRATLFALSRAVAALGDVDYALIDGNDAPDSIAVPSEAIIKGDFKEACIASASIIAKVTRDRMMIQLHETYPGYGFDTHKGYGTKVHMEALRSLGPSPEHRRSFSPLSEMSFP